MLCVLMFACVYGYGKRQSSDHSVVRECPTVPKTLSGSLQGQSYFPNNTETLCTHFTAHLFALVVQKQWG